VNAIHHTADAGNLHLEWFTEGLFQNNTYLVADTKSRDCVILDPYWNAEKKWTPTVEGMGYRVTAIWLTHCHIDHVFGLASTQRAFPNVPTFVHPDSGRLLQLEHVPSFTGGARTLESYAKRFEQPLWEQPPHPLSDFSAGDKIKCGTVKFEILHVPGHCAGHVAFLPRDSASLVSGDVIFKDSIGFTSIPGSSPTVLADSINREILPLDDATTIYPGHGPATTMARERTKNPYLLKLLASEPIAHDAPFKY